MCRVTIIPTTGLAQIPLPPGGRPTSAKVLAPASVDEGRKFRLAGQVLAPQGVPEGRCVFYRIRLDRPKEVANVPVRGGRGAAVATAIGVGPGGRPVPSYA